MSFAFNVCVHFAKKKGVFRKVFNNTLREKLEVMLQMKLFAEIKLKCLPVLFYGIVACQVNSAVRQLLEFTMTRVLFKIFWAIYEASCYEICKYFGIKMKEFSRVRQKKNIIS